MHRDRFYTLSASCPDRVGIVARVAHAGRDVESAIGERGDGLIARLSEVFGSFKANIVRLVQSYLLEG